MNYNYQPEKMAAASYSLGVSPAVCPPVKDASEIEQRLNNLDGALDELRALTAGLQVKLQNVLVPQMKGSANECASAPRPLSSPLGDRLENLHFEYRQTQAILRDVYERIAL